MTQRTTSRTRIRQLEAFHAVLQTGSATRAAELLRISQPSVSKLLQDLEKEIGVSLFERTRKRLFPTPEGHRLGQEVEALFLKLSHIEHVANEIRAKGIGELRIAALPALGLRLIPQMLANLRRERPEIRAVLSVVSSQHTVEMVASGAADLGFAYPVPGTPATLMRHTLAVLPAVAVLPRGHRLARRAALTPRDFEGEPMVSLGREDRTRDNMELVFEKVSLGLAVAVETPFAAVACELVAAGVGAGLVDPVTASFFRDRLVIKPLEPGFSFDFGALTRVGQPQSSVVHAFLSMVAQAIRAIGPALPLRASRPSGSRGPHNLGA
jgi:DNA-binding transcriptional LysR family regulator